MVIAVFLLIVWPYHDSDKIEPWCRAALLELLVEAVLFNLLVK